MAGQEELTASDQHTERVMLTMRRSSGLPWDELDQGEQLRAQQSITDGLTELVGHSLVLSNRGRLLADGVVRNLLVE